MSDIDQSSLDVQLEFPISLESVLSIQLNYENLKVVLDFILGILRRQDQSIKSFSNLPSQFQDITKVLNDLTASRDSLLKKSKKSKERINTNKEAIEKLQNLPAPDSSGNFDLSDLMSRIQQHQEQLDKQRFELDKITGVLEDHDSRLSELEKRSGYNIDADKFKPIDPRTNEFIDPTTGLLVDPVSGKITDPKTELEVDPGTGLLIDPEVGQFRDSFTGHFIDKESGRPFDVLSSQFIDPKTGFPIDPEYNVPKDPTSGYYVDSESRRPIDPKTGEHIQTTTGMRYDAEKDRYTNPNTGLTIDTFTGRPFDHEQQKFIHPETGMLIDESGYPVDDETGHHIDPHTKRPFNLQKRKFIDPNSGNLLEDRPRSSPIGKYYSPQSHVPSIYNVTFGKKNLDTTDTGVGSEQIQTIITRIQEIERKQSHFHESITEINSKYIKTDEQVSNVEKRVGNNEVNISSLGERMDNVERLISQLQDQLSKVEGVSNQNKDDCTLLRKLLKQFEDILRQKVDAEDFDGLRSAISSMGGGGGAAVPTIPTKDLNLIKELKRKMDEFEETMAKLQQLNPEMIQDLFSRVSKLEQQIRLKANTSDIEDLQDQLKKLKLQLDHLEQMVRDLQDHGGAHGEPSGEGSGGIDPSKFNSLSRRVVIIEEQITSMNMPSDTDLTNIWNEVKKLWDAFKELKDRLDKFQKDTYGKLKELEELVKNKSDLLAMLKELEERIMDRLLKELSDFGKKFANKSDTKKALKYLERLIREYMDTVKERREGDDAMLARKPLGGWSCASCEKNLDTLMGRKAPYNSWNKMPYRDPADRIARVGPGFSRMLATVQPEVLSNRTRTSQYRPNSPHSPPQEADELRHGSDMVTLPPVKGADRPTSSSKL